MVPRCPRGSRRRVGVQEVLPGRVVLLGALEGLGDRRQWRPCQRGRRRTDFGLKPSQESLAGGCTESLSANPRERPRDAASTICRLDRKRLFIIPRSWESIAPGIKQFFSSSKLRGVSINIHLAGSCLFARPSPLIRSPAVAPGRRTTRMAPGAKTVEKSPALAGKYP